MNLEDLKILRGDGCVWLRWNDDESEPFITCDGTVELDGDFNLAQLRVLVKYLEEKLP